jgi:hypothetical protein
MKWLLPICQLVLALACYLYEPYQYRARNHYVTELDYFIQHYPPPIGRIYRGLNFPALLLSYPYERVLGPMMVSDTGKVVGFFLGVAIFWYWVGRRFDRGSLPRSLRARIAGLSAEALFAILTATLAGYLIATRAFPEKQIGLCRIAWACLLTTDVLWRLTREIGARKKLTWDLLPIAGPIIFAFLWIGGPFGLTKALGDFPRPTRVEMNDSLPGGCGTDEAPPAALMRIVEAQKDAYHLDFQKIAVCHSYGLTLGDMSADYGFPGTDGAWSELQKGSGYRTWFWPYAARGLYDFH